MLALITYEVSEATMRTRRANRLIMSVKELIDAIIRSCIFVPRSTLMRSVVPGEDCSGIGAAVQV